jgi:hypothetical protein
MDAGVADQYAFSKALTHFFAEIFVPQCHAQA